MNSTVNVDESRTNKRRREPLGHVRTCVGCGKNAAPEGLIRVVVGPEGDLHPDLAGGAFGRGAWVHPSSECLRRAVPRGFARSFKCEITTGFEPLAESIAAAAQQRVGSLLMIARRAGQLALGSTAVEVAAKADTAALFVVATDARAAAEAPWVTAAVAEGRAVSWGTKESLGDLFGRGELGILAVLEQGLSDSVAKAVALTQLASPRLCESGIAKASTEAR